MRWNQGRRDVLLMFRPTLAGVPLVVKRDVMNVLGQYVKSQFEI